MTTFWPHGTMIVMGFVGFQFACANAGAAMATERTAAAPAASQLRLLRSMTLLLA
jgi:hypothetical protein